MKKEIYQEIDFLLQKIESVVRESGKLSVPDFFEFRKTTNTIRKKLICELKGE